MANSKLNDKATHLASFKNFKQPHGLSRSTLLSLFIPPAHSSREVPRSLTTPYQKKYVVIELHRFYTGSFFSSCTSGQYQTSEKTTCTKFHCKYSQFYSKALYVSLEITRLGYIKSSHNSHHTAYWGNLVMTALNNFISDMFKHKQTLNNVKFYTF